MNLKRELLWGPLGKDQGGEGRGWGFGAKFVPSTSLDDLRLSALGGALR